MGGRGVAYTVLVWKPEGKKHLGNPGVEGRIILRWIFKKWYVGGGVWTGSSWLRILVFYISLNSSQNEKSFRQEL